MGRHERIGKLQVLKKAGADESRAVILLHGFGADASDLFSLHEMLDPGEQWSWYFPEAPHEVPIGPGFYGRAWFPISLRDLETGVDYSRVRPPGLDEAARRVGEMVSRIPEEKIVIGGFSQGAMTATEVTLSHSQALQGLLIFSGTLIDQDKWRTQAAQAPGFRFLSCHGSQDSVLPYSGGQKLYELLKKSGWQGEHVAFPGGHEIGLPALVRAQEFLKSCLA